MNNTNSIPTRPIRKFVPEDLIIDSWDKIKTLFDNLVEREISSDLELEKWMLDRSELDAQMDKFKRQFIGAVPRPSFWGGYRIHPTYYEFWQGRENRYHDRIVYKKDGHDWLLLRLNP